MPLPALPPLVRLERQRVAACLRIRLPTILIFYSSNCSLCKSLEPEFVACEEQAAASSLFTVARINANYDAEWAPELLAFHIEQVPCLVLLDERHRATCRSGLPRSREHMAATLLAMMNAIQKGKNV